MVSAVVNQTRYFNHDRFEPLAEWQGSFRRHGAYVYRPTEDRTRWAWAQLLPDAHFENEAARSAISILSSLVQIPINNAEPERIRALASLADYVSGLPEDDRPLVINTLNQTGRLFGVGALNMSPTVPLIALESDQFGAAFVAATLDGASLAGRSSLGDALRLLHGTGNVYEGVPVLAGRLFYAEGSVGEGATPARNVTREVVADGIWCATVALKRHPESGSPWILAIGVAEDEGEQPVSRLLLYRREADGTWNKEVILSDRPVVDADFAFGAAGDIRIVAAVAASELEAKTHLIMLGRRSDNDLWILSSSAYSLPNARTTDKGVWPRILVDSSDRSVVVFAHFFVSLQWMVAVQDGNDWRITVLKAARESDVTGSSLPAPTGRTGTGWIDLDAPVHASAVSLAHWAPAITPAGEDAIWCAYGNGMLNLARINTATLDIEDGVVEVDRATGFYPAVATRGTGAPAVVYKDPWGPVIWGLGNRDHLHFLTTDDSNIVPRSDRFGPLMPPYGVGGLSVAGFAPHVRLDCDNLTNPQMLPLLLASILRHRRFHVEILPSDGAYPADRLNYRRSHPRLAGMVEGLNRRPTVTVFTIDNEQHSDEDIERIEITSFVDPVATVEARFASDLDQGTFPDEMGRALARQQIVLHKRRLTVQIINQGNSWDVTDAIAFSIGATVIPQMFQVRRRNDSELEVRLPPVLSVVQRNASVGSDGRPEPCGHTQDFWDSVAGPFVSRFTGLPLDLPEDAPGRVEWAFASNIHVSRYEPWDPSSEQQGGVRFTIRIPFFFARNENPGANIRTTEPSFIYVVVAPYVRNGRIHWWVRETEVRMGHVEADVDFGFFDWLRFLSIIPGVGILLLIADPIADSIATSSVNDDLTPPNTDSFQGLLREALQGWVDHILGEDPVDFEAVHLRQFWISTWIRSRRPEIPLRSVLQALPPNGISFPKVTIGVEPSKRNMVLTSVGGIPALLEEVRISSGEREFRIESPIVWPTLIDPGDSVVVTLGFDPAQPPGFRSGEVTVLFNGGQNLTISLGGLALPPPEPTIRLRPDTALNFGVVVAGQQTKADVEVFNDGDASLEVAVPDIDGVAVARAALSVVAPAPLSVPAGSLSVIRLRFAPPLA